MIVNDSAEQAVPTAAVPELAAALPVSRAASSEQRLGLDVACAAAGQAELVPQKISATGDDQLWRQDVIPDGTSDGDIADQAQAVELLTGDRGGVVTGQPVFHGLPLIERLQHQEQGLQALAFCSDYWHAGQPGGRYALQVAHSTLQVAHDALHAAHDALQKTDRQTDRRTDRQTDRLRQAGNEADSYFSRQTEVAEATKEQEEQVVAARGGEEEEAGTVEDAAAVRRGLTLGMTKKVSSRCKVFLGKMRYDDRDLMCPVRGLRCNVAALCNALPETQEHVHLQLKKEKKKKKKRWEVEEEENKIA
ncbi:MAG: hypothetical protein FRX49_09181 [Trebouxia sp. A1-2]|nr:MAG: hypothetical protein FRX49_09181 [Trebouxia sp. A1-2]